MHLPTPPAHSHEVARVGVGVEQPVQQNLRVIAQLHDSCNMYLTSEVAKAR